MQVPGSSGVREQTAASKLFRLIPIATFFIRPGLGRLVHCIFVQFQGNTNVCRSSCIRHTLFCLHDVHTCSPFYYWWLVGLNKGLAVVEVFCEGTLTATRARRGRTDVRVRAIVRFEARSEVR